MANLQNSPEQCMTEITKTEVQEKLKKMSYWIAQRPDHVQVFWINHVTVLFEKISKQIRYVLNHVEGNG